MGHTARGLTCSKTDQRLAGIREPLRHSGATLRELTVWRVTVKKQIHQWVVRAQQEGDGAGPCPGGRGTASGKTDPRSKQAPCVEE